MIPGSIDKSRLAHKPGVYIFHNSQGQILYVGKAIDLYHRVASYFFHSPPWVDKISTVETIVVESELEALILEANLIKKYLPPFNIRLTDDKDYLYIGITKDDFPKIVTIRKQDLGKINKFFGPFPSSKTVRYTLKLLRRVFPWCSNAQTRFVNSNPNRVWKARACFYYHLGLCPGACVGLISREDYNKIIRRFAKFLQSKKEELVNELIDEMEEAAREQKFEEAGKVKKIIDGITYLTQTNRAQLYMENPNFLQDERNLTLQDLQKVLNLPNIPVRIEGYDISNIQGKEAVGSMVVLTDGEIDKSQYRKFKIYISGRSNDVAMMREIVRRRLKHQDWLKPDLIIVDGGIAQARGAKLEIENCKLEIPVLGLAKRMEWLYPPQGDVIKLAKRSLSLLLLQKIRDEAHRFAITYHRKLHQKSVILTLNENPLEVFFN